MEEVTRANDVVALMWQRLSRADAILLVLPPLFLCVYGITVLLVETRAVALGVAAIVALTVILDGLFWHPPTDD